jgi:hypothetical protein
MSHYHSPEDMFPNLEDANGNFGSEVNSLSSVVRKSPMLELPETDNNSEPLLQEEVPFPHIHRTRTQR